MSFIKKFIIPKKIPYCSAIILAAGNSTRMGFNKITADLSGEPVISRTIRAFQNNENIKEIIIVTKHEMLSEIANICFMKKFNKVVKVIEGGETRLESSLLGVSEVNNNSKIIAIHDGARPLVSDTIINNTIKQANAYYASCPVIKSPDTVKIINDRGVIENTLNRDQIYLAQTPQVFNTTVIKGALTKAVKENIQITDDCSAVERFGIKVYTVEGDVNNIKLTTKKDFLFAEALLKELNQ